MPIQRGPLIPSLRHLAFSPKGLTNCPSLRAYIPIFLTSLLPTKQGREELLTAAVERGPSEGARSGSKESSSRPYVFKGQPGRSSIARVE